MKRQITETEKLKVKELQQDKDGTLRCFISGEIVTEDDIIEYDHVQPFSKDGVTDLSNIRIVKKTYNRRKSDQSLYEIRDNLRLERLFNDKKNKIKLQDIFKLKGVQTTSFVATKFEDKISVEDNNDKFDFPIFYDKQLEVNYFYGRIKTKWIENDDEKGLQPRYIVYKRLIALRNHLSNHPQLAPSISRLVNNKIKLFDGQHKFAAQILNNNQEIDVKVYISPSDQKKAKILFDQLMITNLEAHSKHKQIPFYTSTLLDKLSEIHKEFLEKFIETKPVETHTEENFINYLITEENYSQTDARNMLISAIKSQAKDLSPLKPYIANASRDANYPITDDLLNKRLFPNTLYLKASKYLFKSDFDFRDSENENFKVVAEQLVEQSFLKLWVPKKRNASLTNEQLKARRVWHKGAIMTWSPYLKDIIINVFNMQTQDERDKMLYRRQFSDDQKDRLKVYLDRLFSHPLWDEPEGEIDSLLSSSKKQDELFIRKGLTFTYVLTGNADN